MILVAKPCNEPGIKLLYAQQHALFTSRNLCKPVHIMQLYLRMIHFSIIPIYCKKPRTVVFCD
jgi:hypothetical protein